MCWCCSAHGSCCHHVRSPSGLTQGFVPLSARCSSLQDASIAGPGAVAGSEVSRELETEPESVVLPGSFQLFLPTFPSFFSFQFYLSIQSCPPQAQNANCWFHSHKEVPCQGGRVWVHVASDLCGEFWHLFCSCSKKWSVCCSVTSVIQKLLFLLPWERQLNGALGHAQSNP